LSQRLIDGKIVGGVNLNRWYPELPNATLWCTTEVITKEQIDTAANIVAAVAVEATVAT
jgi:glycine dehydrogenase subunit 1